MFRLAIFFVIGCAGLGAFSLPQKYNADSRIVGGLSAANFNIPYIVSLQSMGHHKCGGSIINERTILTAAHCLTYERPSSLRVLAGSKKSTLGYVGQLMGVKALHSHENYKSSGLDFDIGLVRLSSPLRYCATVQPIRLPASGEGLIAGIYGIISGWGLTHPKDTKGPDTLQYAIVPVVDQRVCNRLLGNLTEVGKITDRMVCAGYLEGGIDSCQMDSGGPYVSQDKQIGIVSWGDGCAQPNKPGVYARVSAFIPWIKTTLRVHYNEYV